jgi:hypothetical protein
MLVDQLQTCELAAAQFGNPLRDRWIDTIAMFASNRDWGHATSFPDRRKTSDRRPSHLSAYTIIKGLAKLAACPKTAVTACPREMRVAFILDLTSIIDRGRINKHRFVGRNLPHFGRSGVLLATVPS